MILFGSKSLLWFLIKLKIDFKGFNKSFKNQAWIQLHAIINKNCKLKG